MHPPYASGCSGRLALGPAPLLAGWSWCGVDMSAIAIASWNFCTACVGMISRFFMVPATSFTWVCVWLCVYLCVRLWLCVHARVCV